MASIAVQNTTDQPQVVCETGQVIGAGEFGVITAPDARTTQLLDSAVLQTLSGDPDSPDIDPSAAAALRAVAPKPAKSKES